MQDVVCLEKFEKYLTDVKKASANTLASYMRDVRQLSDYVAAHDLPELDELPTSPGSDTTESRPPLSAAA